MGFYIETPSNLNKAAYIVAEYNGLKISEDEARAIVNLNNDQAVIVVVENGAFEAAAYAFSPEEFEIFTRPQDQRRKTFVTISRKLAIRLTGFRG